MSDDEFDHQGQLNLAKLKSLRESVNWEIEENRREFLRSLNSLIKRWEGQFPNLRDVFRNQEIDLILKEFASTKSVKSRRRADRFIDFFTRTDYQDEPELDENSKPLLRRTTALHLGISSFFAINLFKIYNRFDVNYTDESGFSHFHAACKYGCGQVVQKFLKLGQDPNCVVPKTGDSPLHLALEYNQEEVFEMLLKNGADPNLANAKGLTPLHMIANKLDDDNVVDFFFKTCDKKNHLVPIDPLDNRGRTPLLIAVSNFLPHIVGVLLDRGADLSKFVFPAENDFRSKPWLETRWDDFRLRLASGALGVVEHLEKRGYQMERSDAMTIMKLFVKYKMFEKSTDVEKCFNDEEFAKEAKEPWIYPRMWLADELGCDSEDDEVSREAKKTWDEKRILSLYDLIHLRPEEAEKRLTFEDYFEHGAVGDFECDLDEEYEEVCILHLCEKMSKRFFREWALEPFLELTHNRLPILCCEIIIENLMNEDLWNIFLAAESTIHEDDVIKCNNKRTTRVRKASKKQKLD